MTKLEVSTEVLAEAAKWPSEGWRRPQVPPITRIDSNGDVLSDGHWMIGRSRNDPWRTSRTASPLDVASSVPLTVGRKHQ